MDDLGNIVGGAAGRIAETLDDKTMTLTTGWRLARIASPRFWMNTLTPAERKLTATHQRIETELGRRMDDLEI